MLYCAPDQILPTDDGAFRSSLGHMISCTCIIQLKKLILRSGDGGGMDELIVILIGIGNNFFVSVIGTVN